MVEDKYNNKKKAIIGIIISGVFLIVLVTGATYAFFSINVSNGSTSTNINVNMGKLNNIAIKGTENNTLHIKVSSEDMKSDNKNTNYYATTDASKNYLKENEDHVINIANLLVEREMTPTNICTAKLKVEMDGELKDALQAGDTVLHVEGGRSKHDIDLSLLLEEYPIEFVVDESDTQKIDVSLKLINRDADQTYIAGKTLSVTLTIEGLTCKVQNPDDAVEKILATSEKYLEKAEDVSLRGDVLRRFQGTVTKREDGTIENDVNNYICFGTSDSEICKGDTDHYMYRIIGVATNNDETTNTKYGQLKLIKKEALENKYQWGGVNIEDDIEWPDSLISKGINGSNYYTNTNYVPTGWENKIANHSWFYGDITYSSINSNQTNKKVYAIENGKELSMYYKFLGVVGEVPKPDNAMMIKVYSSSGSVYKDKDIYYKMETEKFKKVDAKCGLMNLSDYYLSLDTNTNCITEGEKCKAGWMYLSNSDSSVPTTQEWMMNRYGFFYEYGQFDAWNIDEYGKVHSMFISYNADVRPVFYLTSGLELSGNGTLSDPFIITN